VKLLTRTGALREPIAAPAQAQQQDGKSFSVVNEVSVYSSTRQTIETIRRTDSSSVDAVRVARPRYLGRGP